MPNNCLSKLAAHTSCVNALAFSSGEGRFLASGGDDFRIYLWDFHQEDVTTPIYTLHGPKDGRILLHDGRVNGLSRAQSTLQLPTEATGVQYHPTMEHIFATCDNRGGVFLRDTRMAFGPLSTRTREGVVQKYLTKLTRKTHSTLCKPEASSLTFNSDGSKLAVVMLNFLSTIYGLSDPIPLAVCSGTKHPDGTPVLPPERGYSNSCTIKNGAFSSFGLNSDEFYCAGSEDFRGYMWKVPMVDQLVDRRIEVSADDWASQIWSNVTAFTRGRQTPSPMPTSPCAPNLQRTSTNVRVLEEDSRRDRAAYFRALADMEQSESEEMTAIRIILRDEGNMDVFDGRQWGSEHSSSDEMESIDGDDDDDDDFSVLL
ncbi:hypothetical protein C0995_013894 [Termitomyces sp. Mi166|nr:hypothetical protein C0995_013894 [Termitomyces sp. Mi166\